MSKEASGSVAPASAALNDAKIESPPPPQEPKPSSSLELGSAGEAKDGSTGRTLYMSEKWDPIIEEGIVSAGVASCVAGALATIATRSGGGYRLGALALGVGFGLGNFGMRAWEERKG